MPTSTRQVGSIEASGSSNFRRVEEAADEDNHRLVAAYFDISALPGPVLKQILQACKALDVASVSMGRRALSCKECILGDKRIVTPMFMILLTMFVFFGDIRDYCFYGR
jgi:hypothetical protein